MADAAGQDHPLLARRHVFTVAMSFYTSRLGENDKGARRQVEALLLRAAQVPAAASHLLQRSAVGEWLRSTLLLAIESRTGGDAEILKRVVWAVRLSLELLRTSAVASGRL